MEDINLKVTELLEELSSCREDERSAQSQILQVVGVVATVLGILTGASYINTSDQNVPILHESVMCGGLWSEFLNAIFRNITAARVVYWLSVIIFSMAFSYVTYLGAQTVFRYAFIQNLEDRIAELTNVTMDDEERGLMLHWNSFSSPVFTKNIKHIHSLPAFFCFFSYIASIILCILFSIVLLITLLNKIDPISTFDIVVMAVMLSYFLAVMVLFVYFTSHSEKIIQTSWDVAHDNQSVRLGIRGERTDAGNISWTELVKYLILPKGKDPQKLLIMPLGYLCGYFLSREALSQEGLLNLLTCTFIFEILIYQVRYQINDLRGLGECGMLSRECRFHYLSGFGEKFFIKCSMVSILFKLIMAAALILQLNDYYKTQLLVGSLLLATVTVCYEFFREKNIVRMIYFSVGFGYPIRFSSILAWEKEVTDNIKSYRTGHAGFPSSYRKRYYLKLQDLIRERYEEAEKHIPLGGTYSVIPTRERDTWRDPWFVLYVGSLLSGSLIGYCYTSNVLYLAELPIVFVFALNLLKNHIYKVVSSVLYLILICLVSILIMFQGKHCGFVPFLQFLFTATYFYLDFQPQMPAFKVKGMVKKTCCFLIKVVFGQHILDVLKDD